MSIFRQSNAKGMHLLEIVGLLIHVYTENTAANIPPAPLKVQLHENTKAHLCWCHCVNMIISKLILRDGKIQYHNVHFIVAIHVKCKA